MQYIQKVYTMRNLSLKLEESIFRETEDLLKNFNIPRNRYINQALDHYNKLQKRKLLQKQLEKESVIVADNSMDILSEFELLEHEY